VVREREAAQHIGMSIAFLRQARRDGRGPAHFRLGRTVRYQIADLDAWLSIHRVGPGSLESSLTGCRSGEVDDAVMIEPSA
jgi:hypothetical protein